MDDGMNNHPRVMRHGSLFSGIGGIDLGFDMSGIKCSWQVENDPKCLSVLKNHWPDVPKFGDICTIGVEELEKVEIISGGFPCQDVSIAGRRDGLKGVRSGLWFEFHRIIDGLKPEWVVVENVPGLLSSNGGRDFATIIRSLDESGYGVAWRILDSQWFGVAQRRRRVFIVGSLGDFRSSEVLLGPGSGFWDTRKSAKKIEEVTETAIRLSSRRGQDGLIQTPSRIIAGTIGTRGNKSHTEIDGHGAHVIVESGDGSLVGVRRLTPTEYERLMGFPDGWTSGQADSHRYKQLGNAVVVPVASWLSKRIITFSDGVR